MQGIVIAIIGLIGLTAQSVIALSNGPGRRLRRIQHEVEALKIMPEAMVDERRLLRLALNQTLWEYAIARRPIVRALPTVGLGLIGTAMAAAGGQLVLTGDVRDLIDPDDSGNLRGTGALMFAAGAYLYVLGFTAQYRAMGRRARSVFKKPTRTHQLIAAEALRLEEQTLEAIARAEGIPHEIDGIKRWLHERYVDENFEPIEAYAAKRSGDDTQPDVPV